MSGPTPRDPVRQGRSVNERLDILELRSGTPARLSRLGAGPTSERNVFYMTPATEEDRAMLANQRPTWFNTDRGWDEGYFAPATTAGLTVPGLVAGVPAGWYPLGHNGPEVRLEPLAPQNVTNGQNVTGWTDSVWRRGGADAFTFFGSYQILTMIPGYYDAYFWTSQQAGGGTADYTFRHVNAANNAVPRYVAGLAYTLNASLWTHVHGEMNNELMLAGERFDVVCVSGTLAVHQGGSGAIRGQFGAKYRGPALVSI